MFIFKRSIFGFFIFVPSSFNNLDLKRSLTTGCDVVSKCPNSNFTSCGRSQYGTNNRSIHGTTAVDHWTDPTPAGRHYRHQVRCAPLGRWRVMVGASHQTGPLARTKYHRTFFYDYWCKLIMTWAICAFLGKQVRSHFLSICLLQRLNSFVIKIINGFACIHQTLNPKVPILNRNKTNNGLFALQSAAIR